MRFAHCVAGLSDNMVCILFPALGTYLFYHHAGLRIDVLQCFIRLFSLEPQLKHTFREVHGFTYLITLFQVACRACESLSTKVDAPDDEFGEDNTFASTYFAIASYHVSRGK